MNKQNHNVNPDLKPVEWTNPPAVAPAPPGQGPVFSFISRKPSLRFWVFKPSGDPDCDYQAGRHYGEEVLNAAANDPKLVGDLLSKAMLFLPKERNEYRHILRGLFERMTEELARASLVEDVSNYQQVELKGVGE